MQLFKYDRITAIVNRTREFTVDDAEYNHLKDLGHSDEEILNMLTERGDAKLYTVNSEVDEVNMVHDEEVYA